MSGKFSAKNCIRQPSTFPSLPLSTRFLLSSVLCLHTATAHALTQHTIQTAGHHSYIAVKNEALVLENHFSEHCVWNFEHVDAEHVALQDPKHKLYLVVNHQGQLHLAKHRDHTSHWAVKKVDDRGNYVIKNVDGWFITLSLQSHSHLAAKKHDKSEEYGKEFLFEIEDAQARMAAHHHIHHAKDHQ